MDLRYALWGILFQGRSRLLLERLLSLCAISGNFALEATYEDSEYSSDFIQEIFQLKTQRAGIVIDLVNILEHITTIFLTVNTLYNAL